METALYLECQSRRREKGSGRLAGGDAAAAGSAPVVDAGECRIRHVVSTTLEGKVSGLFHSAGGGWMVNPFAEP